MALCWAVCIWECKILPDTLINNCHLMWIPSRLCVCPGFLSVLQLCIWLEVSTGLQQATQKGRKPSKRGGDSHISTGAVPSWVPCCVEWVLKPRILFQQNPSKAICYLQTIHILPCAFSSCVANMFWEVGAKRTCPVDLQKGLTCGFLLTGSSSADRWADVFGATHNNWKIFPAR